MHAKSFQSYLTLCNPADCSPPGSSVHGISQARILEWVATSSSRGSSRPRDWTQVSSIAGRLFTTEPQGKPVIRIQELLRIFCLTPLCKTLSIVVQSLSRVWLFAVPWTAALQALLSFIISWSLLKLLSIESVMPSNHLILCCPLLLLPSNFPRIRVFSSNLAFHIRWPKYWSFSISPSSEYYILRRRPKTFGLKNITPKKIIKIKINKKHHPNFTTLYNH